MDARPAPVNVPELLERLREAPRGSGIHFHLAPAQPPVFVPYAGLCERVQACMAYLAAQGIRRGTRVIVPFETDPRTLCMFLALIAAGALPLSIKPRLLATQDSYAAFIATLVQRFGAGCVLATPGLHDVTLPIAVLALPPESALQGGSTPMFPAALDDLAFVQFSSGTTDFPKGVPVTHGMLTRNLAGITRHDGRRPDDVCVTWLPLYHDMGLLGGLLSNFVLPNPVHLYPPMDFLLDPLHWLGELSRQHATGTVIPNFAVDYALRYLRTTPDLGDPPPDFSQLRIIYDGSDFVDMDTLDEFCTRLAPYGLRREAFQPCYGMAEAALMVSADANGPKLRTFAGGMRAVCVGRPLEGFQVRITSASGVAAKDGEAGEIELAGGTLAERYFESDVPLTGADGYYRTGDIGARVDGELYVIGRSADRMKVDAQNQYPYAFEQALNTLGFIRRGRCAVFEDRGRVIALAEPGSVRAVLRRGHHRERIVECLLRRTGVKLRVDDVHFLRYGQLDKTSSGKLQRGAVREAYRAGRLRDSSLAGYCADRLKLRVRRGLFAFAARRHRSAG